MKKSKPVVYKSLLIFFISVCLSPVLHAGKGDLLRNAMIWHPNEGAKAVGFRKQFNYYGQGGKVSLFIFADNRYMLWINGEYVMRGPCRFDPLRPEYDSLEVSKYLHRGKNTIAVLVYGHVSSGESMEHTPGFALNVQSGRWQLTTDTS